jgi:hypothetical protein
MDLTLPMRQQPAHVQQAAGVIIPYFVHDMAKPVTYHLTLAVLKPEGLDRLVRLCRRHAAEHFPNEHDNRETLDYPITDRERHAFLRHCAINRSTGNANTVSGYMNGYDNLISKINRKGIDVDNRVRQFKEHVCALITATYPNLALESSYYLWRTYGASK